MSLSKKLSDSLASLTDKERLLREDCKEPSKETLKILRSLLAGLLPEAIPPQLYPTFDGAVDFIWTSEHQTRSVEGILFPASADQEAEIHINPISEPTEHAQNFFLPSQQRDAIDFLNRHFVERKQ